MALPDVVTREQRLAARTELLVAEKEEARRHDALSARRRRPMAAVDKEYRLEGPQGQVSLAGLSGAARQRTAARRGRAAGAHQSLPAP